MSTSTTTYAPGAEVPGTVYRVIRHLATGGMGSVYEVEDTTVEKHYVLKVLHPQLLAREDLARKIKEEAKMLAKLHHPNIVDVVTAGITQDTPPVPYYVMERLNGVNLRHMLEKKGALDLVSALRVAIDVLDALEHAHEHGVVHRDVKPENIFLHRNASGTTTTKLLDFGVMRLINRKSTDVGRGKFVGTIRYASPEQIMGEAVLAVSDLYAVGLLLYEMIAGRGPFDDVTDAYAIGMAHVQRPPPPLSGIAHGVPLEIERLVHAALAKKPAERPPDAYTFSSELRRLMPGGPLSPRAPQVVRAPTPSDPMAFVATEARITPANPMAVSARPSAMPMMSAGSSGASGASGSSGSSANVLLPVVLAAVVGMSIVVGAIVYVVRPWRAASRPSGARSAVSAASAASTASASAVSSVVPTPPTVSVSASAPEPVAGAGAASAVESAKTRPKAAPRPTTAKKPLRPEDIGFE